MGKRDGLALLVIIQLSKLRISFIVGGRESCRMVKRNCSHPLACHHSPNHSVVLNHSVRPSIGNHTPPRDKKSESGSGARLINSNISSMSLLRPKLLVREFWAIEILSCFTPSKREMSNKCKQHPLKSI